MCKFGSLNKGMNTEQTSHKGYVNFPFVQIGKYGEFDYRFT